MSYRTVIEYRPEARIAWERAGGIDRHGDWYWSLSTRAPSGLEIVRHSGYAQSERAADAAATDAALRDLCRCGSCLAMERVALAESSLPAPEVA